MAVTAALTPLDRLLDTSRKIDFEDFVFWRRALIDMPENMPDEERQAFMVEKIKTAMVEFNPDILIMRGVRARDNRVNAAAAAYAEIACEDSYETEVGLVRAGILDIPNDSETKEGLWRFINRARLWQPGDNVAEVEIRARMALARLREAVTEDNYLHAVARPCKMVTFGTNGGDLTFAAPENKVAIAPNEGAAWHFSVN
jgi:hypothetical protein